MAERVAYVSFGASAVLAGANAVGIRFSNRELAPFWGAGVRFAMAAAVFVVLMLALRLKPPTGRALTGVTVFGVLNIGLGYALAYYALQHMHAGLGQTLLALVPLLTLLLAVVQKQERPRLVAAVGTVLALAGIAVLSRASFATLPPLAIVAAIGSAVCIAQAAVTLRRYPQVHPVAANAVGMSIGAVLLLVASFVAGEEHAIPARVETWIALGYLVVIGSVVVFALYLIVLRHWTASRTAYMFVLAPFVTVALSAWLDDEPVGWALVGGGLLVVAGVYVGALRRAPA